jgi:hypothetical protein
MKKVWTIGLSLGLIAFVPAQAEQLPSRDGSIVYVVRRGDTLIDLATDYLTRPADYRRLQQLNQVANPRRLAVGRALAVPVELLKTNPDHARIVNFRGDVHFEHLGHETAAAVGQVVLEGDVLSTGPNAFSRLAFSDGSFVVVPSNGRVRVTWLRRYVLTGAVRQELSVERGRTESTVSKRQSPGGFLVRTPVSVSSVRGTEFRTAFDEQTGRAATEVLRGVVEVTINGGAPGAVLEPGQGAAVANGAAREVALLSAPDLEAPAQIQSGEQLDFALRVLPDATGYRGRLAMDAGMVDAFAETGSGPGQTRLAFDGIPDGAYFLRVTAVSEDGVEGLPMTYDVMRIRNVVSGLASSAEKVGRRRFYKFRWREEGDGEARFRFQIWRDGDQSMRPIIDQPGLNDTAFTLASLPAGGYSWRVQAARSSFGRRVETWSEVQQLRISR